MELLCRCDDIADDGVELRVLKGLLTAVTSNTLHVHGQALLLVSLDSYMRSFDLADCNDTSVLGHGRQRDSFC